jgi:hypothetical protein
MTTDQIAAIEAIAAEIASDHADAPEVRDGGGPEPTDAANFTAHDLAARLADGGLPTGDEVVETLRDALIVALGEERERFQAN